jgi:hypothetical protein
MDPDRRDSLKGFVIVVAIVVGLLLAIILVSQFVNLDPDDS